MTATITITLEVDPGTKPRVVLQAIKSEIAKMRMGAKVVSESIDEPPDPVVIEMPTGTVMHRVRQSVVDVLAGEFPTLEVLAELEAMRQWLDADPSVRRREGVMLMWIRTQLTRRAAGARKFTVTWEGVQ